MKIFTGTVIRTSEKTAKVAVTRVVAHPVYKKRVKRTKNYLVHDEKGVEVGAHVRFVATKPYSKLKRWKIVTGKEQKQESGIKNQAKEKKGVKPKKANAKKANAK